MPAPLTEQPEPDIGQCHFWIPRKGRYCNMTAKSPSEFCGQHRITDQDGNVLRIPCPFTTSHTTTPSLLKAHIITCSFRPQPPPDCFSLDVNQGLPNMPRLISNLDAMDLTDFSNLSEFIEQTYMQVVAPLEPFAVCELTHPVLDQRLSTCLVGKHVTQLSSLVGNLQHANLLSQEFAYVEFGCGSGELSRYVKDAAGQQAYNLLIDRKKFKLKVGSKFKYGPWKHVLIDIKDLDLSEVVEQPMVAVSKHCCGAAMDLSLRCVLNYFKYSSLQAPVKGMVMAICCHSLCTYQAYCNIAFLNKCNITRIIFEQMCIVSTWAVCGIGKTVSRSDLGNYSTLDGTLFAGAHQLGAPV